MTSEFVSCTNICHWPVKTALKCFAKSLPVNLYCQCHQLLCYSYWYSRNIEANLHGLVVFEWTSVYSSEPASVWAEINQSANKYLSYRFFFKQNWTLTKCFEYKKMTIYLFQQDSWNASIEEWHPASSQHGPKSSLCNFWLPLWGHVTKSESQFQGN